MKTLKNYLLLFALASFVFTSCSSDDDFTPSVIEPEAYEDGILVINEGPFGQGSGTITYVSNDFSTVEQNIYRNVNGSELGNVVNAMGFDDGNAYIVVNNSHKVMIADRYSFEKKDSITTGLENPRFFASNGQTRGYITAWGDPSDDNDDYIAVVDLITNTIATTIPVSYGPEKILNHNGKMYVTHIGGWSWNNVVSVISGTSVEKTITVGDVPDSMVVIGDYLYVLSSGKPEYSDEETAGSLSKIDLNTNEVVETHTFQLEQHPDNLVTDGVNLYYSHSGSVYKTSASSISVPGTAVIDRFFYKLAINDGMLYGTDAGDYASQGTLYIYDLATYDQIKEISAGIIPGEVYFNN